MINLFHYSVCWFQSCSKLCLHKAWNERVAPRIDILWEYVAFRRLLVTDWLNHEKQHEKISTSRLLEIISQSAHPTHLNWEPNPVKCTVVNATLFTGPLGDRTFDIHLTITLLAHRFHHWQLISNGIEPIPSRWSIHVTTDYCRKCLIIKWRWHSNQVKLHCNISISINRI